MFSIMLRTIKDKKWVMLSYGLAGILFLWMYLALFPTIQTQSDKIQEVFGQNEGFGKAFGIEKLNFSTLESFLAFEYFNFIWPMLIIFISISFASTIVRDFERGTMDFTLSRPVSRSKIFAGRAVTALLAVFVFNIVSIFAIFPLAMLHGIDYIFFNYMYMLAIGFLFGAAIVAIACFFSAILSERGRAYLFTGSIIMVMFVINIISAFKESLSNIKYLSLFYYYDPGEAVINSSLSVVSIGVLTAVAVVGLAAGAFVFKRRDVNASS